MYKSRGERRKYDVDTIFLYGFYAYSVQKSMTLQKNSGFLTTSV